MLACRVAREGKGQVSAHRLLGWFKVAIAAGEGVAIGLALIVLAARKQLGGELVVASCTWRLVRVVLAEYATVVVCEGVGEICLFAGTGINRAWIDRQPNLGGVLRAGHLTLHGRSQDTRARRRGLQERGGGLAGVRVRVLLSGGLTRLIRLRSFKSYGACH